MELSRIRGSLRSVEIRLGINLAELVYADLAGLVDRHARESDQVDFKRDLSTSKPQDLARDVASMANHLGGLIFYGIDEQDDKGKRNSTAQRLKAIPSKVGHEHVVDWLTKTIGNEIIPRLEVGMLWIDHPTLTESGFLIVGVARSDRAPHAVDLGGGKFHFQRRRGTSNGPLTESEVAHAYGARQNTRLDQVATLNRRWNEFRTSPVTDPNQTVTIQCAVMPDVLGEWLIHDDAVRATQTWLETMQLADARLFESRFGSCSGRAAQARLRSVQVNTEAISAQFFVDGSCISQMQLPTRVGAAEGDHDRIPEQRLLGGLSRLVRLAAAHALLRAGTFGTASIRVAIWANGLINIAAYQATFSGQSFVPIGTSALTTGPKPIDGGIDLDEVLTSERSASHAAWFLMNELYQAELGVPTCKLMGYDGRYRLSELDDQGLWLGPKPVNHTDHHLFNLNDEVFATLVCKPDLTYEVNIEESVLPANDWGGAFRLTSDRLAATRYR